MSSEKQLLKAAKDGSFEELVVALTERNVDIDVQRVHELLLLSRNLSADLRLTNTNGYTAEQIARISNRSEVADLLKEMRLPSHPLLKPGRKSTAPLTAFDRFVAGLPLQPCPQPDRHELDHDERQWPAIKKRLKEWAAKEWAAGNDEKVKTFAEKILRVACLHKFSYEIILYLCELSGAVETMKEAFTLPTVISAVIADPKTITEKYGDVLHELVGHGAMCRTIAECKNTNILLFTLVAKKASLTATNKKGQTAAEAATAAASTTATTSGGAVERSLNNHHLVASFREIAAYKKRTHLSVMHFRDWTTVSHAWCTPSAKLVALTVLMVGETYKRGLLPRLPMDCWYFILNCIPRHELRQGGCEPADEQVVLAQYSAILREARARIDAAAVATAKRR